MRTRRAFTFLLSVLLMLSLILSACKSINENPSDFFQKQDAPVLGNTPGNLSACGFAARQEDEIYFWPFEEALTEIYKARILDDGSCDCKPLKTREVIVGGNINVADNWIYYYGVYEENDAVNFAICAMRTDGSEHRTVVKWRITDTDEDLFTYTNIAAHYFMVAGDWIYYPNYFDGWKIFAVKTDGSGNHKLNDDFSGYINIVGDQIYYLCAEDNA